MSEIDRLKHMLEDFADKIAFWESVAHKANQELTEQKELNVDLQKQVNFLQGQLAEYREQEDLRSVLVRYWPDLPPESS